MVTFGSDHAWLLYSRNKKNYYRDYLWCGHQGSKILSLEISPPAASQAAFLLHL
jgi:hypothetical protein